MVALLVSVGAAVDARASGRSEADKRAAQQARAHRLAVEAKRSGRAGDFDLGAQLYLKAATLHPEEPRYLYSAARYEQRAGLPIEARRDYREFLRRVGRHHSFRARAVRHLAEVNKALGPKPVRKAPNDPAASDNRQGIAGTLGVGGGYLDLSAGSDLGRPTYGDLVPKTGAFVYLGGTWRVTPSWWMDVEVGYVAATIAAPIQSVDAAIAAASVGVRWRAATLGPLDASLGAGVVIMKLLTDDDVASVREEEVEPLARIGAGLDWRVADGWLVGVRLRALLSTPLQARLQQEGSEQSAGAAGGPVATSFAGLLSVSYALGGGQA